MRQLLIAIITLLMTTQSVDHQKYQIIKQIIIDTKKINDDLTDLLADRILNYSFLLTNKDAYIWLSCLIKHESNFNPGSIGDNNKAYGLGQLHVPTIKFICKIKNLDCMNKNLFDIDFNLFLTTSYLAILEKDFNDIHAAIIAYNSGKKFVKDFIIKYNRLPNTIHYIKIKKCVDKYKNYLKR